jgi:DNA modification methylase
VSVRILLGDVREKLAELPDESVHCVVTSPPYFGLRDYGVAGQIGLEPTPAEFVAVMVDVFREVRRVLRSDGVLWLNLGDSYAGGGTVGRNDAGRDIGGGGNKLGSGNPGPQGTRQPVYGLKPKDLIGIPWRVAFALQADGWYLRQDIIWSKPNPMPESVTDRCTKAHEYLFLLSKSARYHYDAEAIREPHSEIVAAAIEKYAGTPGLEEARRAGNIGSAPDRKDSSKALKISNNAFANPDGRNRRSVWTVATQPFKEAHFATFPPDLIEPCIKAGCPKGGTVLDPFGGAGTTGLVADRLQRDAILIELNPEYAGIAERRIHGDAPMFVQVSV